MTANLLESARHVVEHHSFVCISTISGEIVPTPDAVYDDLAPESDGRTVLLDAVTANLICTVYDALGDEAKAKFLRLDPLRAVDICWKLVKK